MPRSVQHSPFVSMLVTLILKLSSKNPNSCLLSDCTKHFDSTLQKRTPHESCVNMSQTLLHSLIARSFDMCLYPRIMPFPILCGSMGYLKLL